MFHNRNDVGITLRYQTRWGEIPYNGLETSNRSPRHPEAEIAQGPGVIASSPFDKWIYSFYSRSMFDE